MLIEKVIQFYAEEAKKPPGNPFRLSSSGKCARALAYQRFPSQFKAEPLLARNMMIFDLGNYVDAFLKQQFRKHCPKEWKWEERKFFIEVDGVRTTGTPTAEQTSSSTGPP